MHEQPTVNVVEVTPAMAEKWLARVSERQRKVSRSRVAQYAQSMQGGRWKLIQDAIAFDADGNLVNGQHRLHAVVQAGMPQRFVVVVGVDSGSFAYMDRGGTRSAGQFVHDRNGQIVAAAAYFMLCVNSNNYPPRGPARPEALAEVLDYCREHRDELQKAVRVTYDSGASKHVGSPGFLAFLYFFYVFVMGERAYGKGIDAVVTDFFYGVGQGVNLRAGSPALVFRNRINMRRVGDRVDKTTFQALAIKAIKAHIQGKPIKALRWTRSEEFPSLT